MNMHPSRTDLLEAIRHGLVPLKLAPQDQKLIENKLYKTLAFVIKDTGNVCPRDALFQFAEKTHELIDLLCTHSIINKENRAEFYAKYIKCARQQPTLLYQNPHGLLNKVLGAVNQFIKAGLVAPDDKEKVLVNYLHACMRQPSLFCLNEITASRNVTGLAQSMVQKKLITADEVPAFGKAYLAACMHSPSLFSSKPKTIAGHFQLWAMTFSAAGKERTPFEICRNPSILTLSHGNIRLRYIAAQLGVIQGYYIYQMGKSELTRTVQHHLNSTASASKPLCRRTSSQLPQIIPSNSSTAQLSPREHRKLMNEARQLVHSI